MQLLVQKVLGYAFGQRQSGIIDNGNSEGRAAQDGAQWFRQAPTGPSNTGLAVTIAVTGTPKPLASTWLASTGGSLFASLNTLTVFPSGSVGLLVAGAGGTSGATDPSQLSNAVPGSSPSAVTGEAIVDGGLTWKIVPAFAGGVTFINQDTASALALDWYRGVANVTLHSPVQAGDGVIVQPNGGNQMPGCTDLRTLQAVTAGATVALGIVGTS